MCFFLWEQKRGMGREIPERHEINKILMYSFFVEQIEETNINK